MNHNQKTISLRWVGSAFPVVSGVEGNAIDLGLSKKSQFIELGRRVGEFALRHRHADISSVQLIVRGKMMFSARETSGCANISRRGGLHNPHE
jgi:hypothetical protein